jgi:hypothetical protein
VRHAQQAKQLELQVAHGERLGEARVIAIALLERPLAVNRPWTGTPDRRPPIGCRLPRIRGPYSMPKHTKETILRFPVNP